MGTVALVGLAETTREAVKDSKADEIWSLNWAYNYDFIPRIDRLFELHPIWLYAGTDKPEYEKPRKHWAWLQQPHPFKIYMLHQIPVVPACVKYPIDQVVADLFGSRLQRGDLEVDYFSCTFSYMMGLAIYEKWDTVELYGLEMGSDTEYRYQKPGSEFMLGLAIARGITVKLQHNSILAKSKRYGYEGGQMIFRQDLEIHRTNYEKQRRDQFARLQHMEGQYKIILESEGTPEQVQQLQDLESEIRVQRDMVAITAGAFQAINYLIKEVDLQEPELNLIDPFKVVQLKG